MPTALDVLAFEPFDTGSHAAVRESISRHSRHRWRWVTRPGRAWKWRMRLGALELVETAAAQGELNGAPDVIFATSLLALSDLRAALPPALRAVPVVLYMHENQAAYPVGHDTDPGDRDAHFALTNLASALTADRVIWNSAYNRDSFLASMPEILAHAPDSSLGDWAERIRRRSAVIWPPVEVEAGVLHNPPDRDNRGPTTVAWPHRWEHDKGPDELLELALAHSEAHDLRWVILGEQFQRQPPAMGELRQRLADRIDHMGYVTDRTEYLARLAGCDWVLSTARHEFFGIAVVEALLSGCLPWLPERLSYPELLPDIARGLSPMHPPGDPDAVRRAIAAHLEPARAPNAVERVDAALRNVETSKRRNGETREDPSADGCSR